MTKAERLMIVPDEVRRCVVFVYYMAGGMRVPAGTAFLVVDREPQVPGIEGCGYVVTARHVIEGVIAKGDDGNVWLRINTADDGSDWMDLPISMWRSHPRDRDSMWSAWHDEPRYDVSACLFGLDNKTFRFRALPIAMFADEEKISRCAIGAGDDVFLTGLFAQHLGQRRNLPVVRCGNIAAMPEEPVATSLGPMDAVLIEARSIGGLSGSPVFVSLGHLRNVQGRIEPQLEWTIYLLGLVHGHWDAREGDMVTDDFGDREAINKGIAVVVPASQILETIRHPDFMAAREDLAQEYSRNHGPTMDGV